MSIAMHEKITILRDRLGLSRPVFADATGIPVNTIKSIEQKGVVPRADLVEKIARRWPEYALWLLIEEDAPIAGQFTPSLYSGIKKDEVESYQIIDIVDRNLDVSVVKPSEIDFAIFLQTSSNVPASSKVSRIINSTSVHQGVFAASPRDYNSQGTGMLLVVRGDGQAGVRRGVLVKDGCFDIREIEQKGDACGLLGIFQAWFDRHGIRKFDIAGVNFNTIDAVDLGMGELKRSDLYDAPDDTHISFEMWQKHFQL